MDLITTPIKTRQFLSDIIQDDDLARLQPGAFNILRAPRGWGKTTFMFDERILQLARERKHVCYLVHTKDLRDSICIHHPDHTRALTDKDADAWFTHRKQDMWTTEEDVNYIRVMCYQTFAAMIRKDTAWLQDIDLIIWDEFDDIQQYYDQEMRWMKKKFPDTSIERSIAFIEEGNKRSIVAFIYQMQTLVLEPARIILIAISATPEIAAQLFSDRVNYILKGRLTEIFDAKFTYYIDNIAEYFKSGVVKPDDNMCPWIFTPRIHDVLRLAEICRNCGFKVLTFWSRDNANWRDQVTPEMTEGLEYIKKYGMVPAPYNCVITNQVMGRGIDIYDERFQDWFCDSNQYMDIAQFIRARYSPLNKYLPSTAKGLIEFVRSDTHFSECYHQWHFKDEIIKLLNDCPVYNKSFNKRLLTWSQVVKEWEDEIIFEERKYGAKHLKQYRVGGSKIVAAEAVVV